MSLFRLDQNLFELEPLEVRRFLTTASVDGTNTLQILGTSSSETITVNRNSSNRITVTGVASTFAIGSSAGQVNKIFIQAGGGNDTVLLTNNVRFPSNNQGIPATIAGNNGNDTLTGGPGNDVLSGNDGADTMDGGVGNDLITGGASIDTTNYSNRATAIRVSINNNADADGQLSIGENDEVETEEVIGGAGNDTLIGSSLGDFLAGGGGADSLTGNAGADEVIGSTGQDKLFGNDGDDYLGAQNNDQDTVNGGGGALDLASVDAIDVAGDTGPIGPVGGTKALTDSGPIILADNEGSALDSTYGNAGIAMAAGLGWNNAEAAVVDAQGQVYFVGTKFNFDEFSGAAGNDIVVARFTSAGALDTTFGQNGVATIDFTSENGTGAGYNDDDSAGGIALDADGNIIVVGATMAEGRGNSDFAIARLTPAGVLDGTFSGNGMLAVDVGGGSGYGEHANDVVVQANGSIVAVGYSINAGFDFDVAAVRVTDTGALDTSFNSSGVFVFPIGDFSVRDEANAVALQTFTGDDSAQRIVIGGRSGGDFALARLLPDGSLDQSFDQDGKLTSELGGDDTINDLAVNSLNQIIAVGDSSNFLLDTGPQDELAAAAPLPGEVNALLAVYAPNAGAAPTVFEQPPISDSNGISYQAVAIDDDDRIVVTGTDFQDFVVARFLPTLSFDATFNTGHVLTDIQFSDNAFAVGVQSDGKIVAAGTTFLPNESTALVAARYLGGAGGGEEPPPSEDDITEVEGFVDYQDLQQDPPPGPVGEHFENRSNWAKIYMRSQPDDDGVARIDTKDDRVNVIEICTIVTEDGSLNVTVSIDGLVLFYDPETTKLIELRTGGGDDVIEFCEEVDIPFVIHLGDGNDTYHGDHGNNYILGGGGDDDLKGGRGNDLFVGGPGDDAINGGAGFDLLIGGDGADMIVGNADEDILIAGTTAYDDDGAALFDILQEWASGAAFDTRVSNIRNGGGLNGTNVLKTGVGATVFDDGDQDEIHGASGPNWIFFHNTGADQDKITGNTNDDELEFI